MRRRLLAVALASASIVVVAFAVPLGALVRSVANDRAIAAAERDAAALAPVLAISRSPDVVEGALLRTETGADGRIAVWLPGDPVAVGDPTPADPDVLALVRERQQSFSRSVDDGIELYSPVVVGERDVSIVRTRVPDSLLDEGVTTAWAALALVGVSLVAASAFVADRLARTLTREAAELEATADRLAAGDPDARAARSSTIELDAAGRALNSLADRIDELRAAERERVADLSHRLRTPLTALRLDAERVGDEPLQDGLDRLEAAIDHLIGAARRPLAASNRPARCDVVAVARDRVAFWSALADDDERAWSLGLPDGTAPIVEARPDDLGAALDALLDNVFAHTAPGSEYRVSVGIDGDDALLAVDDAGTGLPAGHDERGVSGAGSTGLGVSIASRVAEAAGGRLESGRSELGGARLVLRLPRHEGP